MQLLIATTNQGKLKEIRNALKDVPVELLSLADFPGAPAVVEDSPDFAGNALKKALTFARFSRKTTLADDSGLIVPALDGRPGVYSARFAGPEATDEENVAKLLDEMRGLQGEARSAYFLCVLAVVTLEGAEVFFEGRCEGSIAERPRGDLGFGYDPIFIPREFPGTTFAEMDLDLKKFVSHRGKALERLREGWKIPVP